MNPGRELDALIAEKVFGWTDLKKLHGCDVYSGFPAGFTPATDHPSERWIVRKYSTTIADAWAVIEKLFQLGWDTEVQGFDDLSSSGKPYYRVRVARIDNQASAQIDFSHRAPHAICLAALKAVGYTE